MHYFTYILLFFLFNSRFCGSFTLFFSLFILNIVILALINLLTIKKKSLMLRPHVPGDPRSCQMDGRTISTNIGS